MSDQHPTPTAAAKPEYDDRGVLIVFSCLMLGMLMSSLGQMIFATALPTLVGELGGASHMSWVITAFLLTMTISMPVYGRLGDQWGRKPLYLGAIVLFLIGSIVGALAPSMEWMIIARCIQGAGGGGLMVLSQAIVADVVPARQRGRYMGIMGAVFGLSSVLGPLLGGFFTDGPGWRWALWFNVPLGVVALLIAARVLRLPRRGTSARFDLAGFVILAASTTALIMALTWGGREYAWSSPMIIGLLAGSVLGAAALVVVERRAEAPIIPMDLFLVRNFWLVTAGGLILGIIMFGSLAYLPTYLQMVHHLSPTRAGLMMIPMMAGMIATTTISGQRVTKTGSYKWYPVAGMVVLALGLIALSRWTAGDSLFHVGLVLVILGVGLGLSVQIVILIVQNSFPIARVGTATATNNFFRQIGGALGSALIGSLFSHRIAVFLEQRMPAALEALGPQGKELAASFSTTGQSGLTPAAVHELPPVIQNVVTSSYNDALVPVLGWLTPLAVAALVFFVLVRPVSLKTTIS